ncbi:MAG: Sterol 3-beta-glucosyltransferase [Caeruleum heppii]|nr:MAG: Sterol 3-beta-glucosyltransferase [Caeruleum heppii]
MSSQGVPRLRSTRKLLKKNRSRHRSSTDIPEKFKDGEDANEDVAAPRAGPAAPHLNQSVFSMIAAAGSRTDFNARFDDSSSDGDDEDEGDQDLDPITGVPAARGQELSSEPLKTANKFRKRRNDHKLLKSLPKLSFKGRDREQRDAESQTNLRASGSISQDRLSSSSPAKTRDHDVQKDAQSGRPSSELGFAAQVTDDEEQGVATTGLAGRLMDIFNFTEPEEVVAEYPCWLLKTVLLQGYMYITSKHINFYAYLPKKSNITAKSGYLCKRGRQNPRYNRYWFALKGDVLSYFADPSNLYFPSGNIDLRYGVSAALSEPSEKGKAATSFTVVTRQRTYAFKADSHTSAKEWVRTLQKVIFRSHNDGDSVKVSLPIENVIDIEDSPVLEFAETFKIRVVENDETYAIDEYFFSFFSFGREAISVLKILTDNTPAQMLTTDRLGSPRDQSGSRSPMETDSEHVRDRSRESLSRSTPVLRDTVRATLSPLSPAGSGRASPRASSDFGRSSFDAGRRSVDLLQDRGRPSLDRGRSSRSLSRRTLSTEQRGDFEPVNKPQGSSTSYVHSMDHEPESIGVTLSSNETQASASQILSRSDVFQSPTIPPTYAPGPAMGVVFGHAPARRHSEDSRRPAVSPTEIRVHPPTRSQTQMSSPGHAARPYGDGNSDSEYDVRRHGGQLRQSDSSPTLQELVKAGAYPLQRAAGFAGYLRNRSKKMSSLLATESMGYIEKVSGMWTGARRHYDEPIGLTPDDQLDDLEEDENSAINHGDRFRSHFALPASEKLQATYFGHLHRVLPLYGKIYISQRNFCFRSLLPGTRTKMILPLKDVENVDKEKGFRFGYSGLVIVIRGHEELFFEFSQSETRDDCAVTLLRTLETVRQLQESGLLTQEEKESTDAAKAEHQMLQEARQDGHNEHDLKLPTPTASTEHPSGAPPILFDDPRASIINFKPTESLRVTCLTIGSRGDVQPYIALCKGLLAEGHKPKIATHAEFEPWVRLHGIDFAPVDGDPAELMRICVENGMFTYSFLKEASLKVSIPPSALAMDITDVEQFRGWIDELLSSAWTACQDTDVLVESPSAMAGIHIAEALGIPYFRAFTMPWTRTRAYPHAFAVPEHKMGGAYNYFTYVMFDNVFWKAIAGQVNRWRKKELSLGRTNLDKLQPNKVPFLYNFSPHVVVPPIDYSDWIRVTGYWFLDEAAAWQPPAELLEFIRQARQDKKKIVYVGFGSIVVSDPAALTKTVIDSVLKADVRCILSKGWSDRLGAKDVTEPEVPLPPAIFQIKSAPHDWLFTQIDAAAHHGGAGTTGASLRAGLPTIIKPFFGDQFFFGSRVEDLGVGICIKKLNVSVFSRALWESTQSERIIVKARVLGESIRKEDGVGHAIQAIYRDLEYAKTLVKRRGSNLEETHEESEESWTFIGDDNDPELVKRIREWEPMAQKQTGEEGELVGARSTSLGHGGPRSMAAT